MQTKSAKNVFIEHSTKFDQPDLFFVILKALKDCLVHDSILQLSWKKEENEVQVSVYPFLHRGLVQWKALSFIKFFIFIKIKPWSISSIATLRRQCGNVFFVIAIFNIQNPVQQLYKISFPVKKSQKRFETDLLSSTFLVQSRAQSWRFSKEGGKKHLRGSARQNLGQTVCCYLGPKASKKKRLVGIRTHQIRDWRKAILDVSMRNNIS